MSASLGNTEFPGAPADNNYLKLARLDGTVKDSPERAPAKKRHVRFHTVRKHPSEMTSELVK